jgi:hypothetical protein
MNTTIENSLKQMVAVVLAVLVTTIIVSSIGRVSATDLNGNTFAVQQSTATLLAS